MTPNGKKKLIKSLSGYIQKWFDETDPNLNDATDIGWVGDEYVEQLSTLVITALELNSASQRYMEKEGLLAVSAG